MSDKHNAVGDFSIGVCTDDGNRLGLSLKVLGSRHKQRDNVGRRAMQGRRTHWEGIYQRTTPVDRSWHQDDPALSLELITAAGVPREAPVIDVGGGASVLVDFLVRGGYRDITVLDISAAALAASKKRLGDVADDIQWRTVDITQYVPPRQYAVWHDRAVFHFLTDESDRQQYRAVLEKSVLPGGDVVMATFGLGGPTKCSGLDVVQYDAEKLGAELGVEFQLLNVRDEVHLTPSMKQQQFTYCHFRRASTQ